LLHFAEVYQDSVGGRSFDVVVEGDLVIDDLDIFASVGVFTALTIRLPATVEDGNLTIEFLREIDNPKINAIEIHSAALHTAPSLLGSSVMPSTSPVVPLLLPSTSPSPSIQPTIAPPSPPVAFEPIRINVGGGQIVDPSSGNMWQADNYYNTGKNASLDDASQAIAGTSFDELYRTGRFDEAEYPNLIYSIPIPNGRFRVTLYFAETWEETWKRNARKFNIYLEGALAVSELDIYAQVGNYTALKEVFVLELIDGSLDIEFEHVVENPILNGIEVLSLGEVKPHFAHAVPGGPYVVTDIGNTLDATVAVDGFYSHTHAPAAEVVSWTWKVNDTIVATGEQANITFPVGNHTLILRVEDSTGDVSEDFTTVTVKQFGYPYIQSLTPDTGEMIGGDKVTIRGSGFNVSAEQTVVNFGPVVLSGPSEITVIDDTTIEVLKNPQNTWGKVDVTVTTPLDTSNPVEYEYLPDVPLTFKDGNVATGIDAPTTLAFDPRGNLYVATQFGDIVKYVLDETHNVLETIVSNITMLQIGAETYPTRAILGIAFDPMDSCEPACTMYCSHSWLDHKQQVSYNGAISAVSGRYLDSVKHVITGLPVSDHDHGINGMDFDDHGNLYFQIGGKPLTNATLDLPNALPLCVVALILFLSFSSNAR